MKSEFDRIISLGDTAERKHPWGASTMITENPTGNTETTSDTDSPNKVDASKGKNTGKSTTRKMNRRMISFAALGTILLAVIVSLLYSVSNRYGRQRQEFFIGLDYVEIVGKSFPLPFAIDLSGENNKLALNLDAIERVFPYKERISVVLHGQAPLSDAATGTIRENPEAAMRFSIAIRVDGASLIASDAELDSLSVYSDSPDVQAIVQRKTSECWHRFISAQTPWTIDITHLPFKPERDVQIEDNGVFVFGAEARQ